MKLIVFVLSFLLSASVFAESVQPQLQSITCSTGEMSVVISVQPDSLRDTYVFTLYKNNKAVGIPNSSIELLFGDYENIMLMSYVWGFENEELGTLAVAVEWEENIVMKPGTYAGKSDVYLTSGDAAIEGSSIDCTVVTK